MRVLVIDTALGLCTAGVFEADGDEALAAILEAAANRAAVASTAS